MAEYLHERCRCVRLDGTEVTVLVFIDEDRKPIARPALEDGRPVDWNNRESFIDPRTGERLTIVEQTIVADQAQSPETPP